MIQVLFVAEFNEEAAPFISFNSAPDGTRTHNQQNRNLSFYPIELRVQKFVIR